MSSILVSWSRRRQCSVELGEKATMKGPFEEVKGHWCHILPLLLVALELSLHSSIF